MDKLVIALGPVFAAGFAVQHLLEFLSPIIDRLHWKKKITMGLISTTFGFILAFGAKLRVLEPMGYGHSEILDAIVTALIVSAGTEGINSIMKFLGYAKDQKRSDSGAEEFEPKTKTPKFSVR